MKNKIVKVSVIILGIMAIGYGAFRITEYFAGIVRLKYGKYTIKKYDEPVNQTPLE